MQKESEARQSLMRYHSPQVVEKIIKDKGNIKVNEMTITVLFIDIKDFTSLSESIGPLETAKLLNEYFDIITDIVFQYQGSIDKFIGDAAMFTGASRYRGAAVNCSSSPRKALLFGPSL